MLILAQVNGLVVVLDDGIFLVALYLPEKIKARLDVAEFVQNEIATCFAGLVCIRYMAPSS